MPVKPSRRSDVAAFMAMDMLSRANAMEAAGRPVLHLEVGQPKLGAPATALKAAEAALNNQALGYTEALGIVPLREAISKHYADMYGVDVPASRIVVTTGSSGGFLLAFLALFDAGQKVGLTVPYYPAYPNILRGVDLEPRFIRTGPEVNFRLDAAHLPNDIDGLLLASPANPTGVAVPKDQLKEIVASCEARNIPFISDEIYHGLSFSVPSTTALEFSNEAIVINSFSKYFHMTGWRIGWMVVPEYLVRTVERLAQNLFISAPSIAQIAATAALDCRPEMDERAEGYRRNRDVLLGALKSAGVTRFAPADGAFYIFADVSDFTEDSEDLAHRLLEETGVAVAPGLDFDAEDGRKFIRLSFARAETEIAEAAKRLGDWFLGTGRQK